MKDAVFNMGRIAWLVVAMMKGNTKDMLDGFCDRLHQQQRGAAVYTILARMK